MKREKILEEIIFLCKNYNFKFEDTLVTSNEIEKKYILAQVTSRLEKEKSRGLVMSVVAMFLSIMLFFVRIIYEVNEYLGMTYLFFVVGAIIYISFKQIVNVLNNIKDLSYLKELLSIIVSEISIESSPVQIKRGEERESILSIEKQDDKRKTKHGIKKKENLLIILGFLLATIAVTTPFTILKLTGWGLNSKTFKDIGLVGDFFGGTTVGLLTLASITLVTAAIFMQKEELKLTREEFEKTRGEHELTNATMMKQQFENTFFNMVNLQNEIVASIDLPLTEKKGRSALAEIAAEIEYKIKGTSEKKGMRKDAIFNSIMTKYKEVFKHQEDLLGHYMRNLYRIVKFIVESELSISEKRNYFGILRAQWSKSEFLLIYLNLFSEDGMKFKNFVKQFDILDIEKKESNGIMMLKESVPFHNSIKFFYEDNY